VASYNFTCKVGIDETIVRGVVISTTCCSV